jgi:hypothetical protein
MRNRDVYPGSGSLPIPDLGYRTQKQQQKRGVKKKLLVVVPFFVAKKFKELKIILFWKW